LGEEWRNAGKKKGFNTLRGKKIIPVAGKKDSICRESPITKQKGRGEILYWEREAVHGGRSISNAWGKKKREVKPRKIGS